jgi:hypothetical protein
MNHIITVEQINALLTLLNSCEAKGVAQASVMLTSLPPLIDTKVEQKIEKENKINEKHT